MDEGFLPEVELLAARRRLWRHRREELERALASRPWRKHPIRPVAALTRRALRLVRPTRAFQRLTARTITLGLTRLSLAFPDLPVGFDGYRILHLTDLHLDAIDGTADAAARAVAGVEADLCVLTGDFRDDVTAPLEPVFESLRHILGNIRAPDGALGVLGNHDSAAMVETLEAMGMRILCNEVVHLRRGPDRIHVTGLDDVHRFHTEAAHVALHGAPDGFGVALVHSPEIADRAAAAHRLYLTGHTHGGQICLPGGRPLITGLRRHRHLVSGLWRHGEMVGYTSRGVGASLLPLRFNCRGEIVLVTLRRGPAAAEVSPDAGTIAA